MSAKRNLVIGSVAAAILIAGVAFVKMRSKAPIIDVRWEAKIPKHLDISWYDEEPDKVYKIYWSNQPGIKIQHPHTYRYVTRVTSNLFSDSPRRESHRSRSKPTQIGRQSVRVKAPYEWCYFVISKESSRTQEFEASVLQDTSFNRDNLRPRLVSRGRSLNALSQTSNDVTINVAVLESADTYHVYQYLPDGTTWTDEVDVRGMKSVNLKIPMLEDAMIFIGFRRAEFEHPPEFLAYNEKIFISQDKWNISTRLC